MNGTGISLVVLARDEERLLRELLARHGELCEEVVVVDTGSRDGTVAAARAAGARVIPFAWRDDFAAARNAGLAAAHGRWVLTLDTDERLAAADAARIADVASGAVPALYVMEQRNYLKRRGHPEWEPVAGRYPEEEAGQSGFVAARQVRLFPRRPELRYRGRIHESVEADGLRLGLEFRTLDAVVHHYGHVRDEMVQIRRDALNARLTRLKWREEKGDAAAGLEMATRLVEENRREEAERLLRDQLRDGAEDGSSARARLLLAGLLRSRGRAVEAVGLALEAVGSRAGWLPAWLELARSQIAAGAWADAGRSLGEARRLFGAAPRLVLEECRYLIGTARPAAAARLAAELAARCPDWPEARELAVRCRSIGVTEAEPSVGAADPCSLCRTPEES